jgi:hypothetical protein
VGALTERGASRYSREGHPHQRDTLQDEHIELAPGATAGFTLMGAALEYVEGWAGVARRRTAGPKVATCRCSHALPTGRRQRSSHPGSRADVVAASATDEITAHAGEATAARLLQIRCGAGDQRRSVIPCQTRPGSRVVTSWTSHVLPSGSLKEKNDS